MQGSGIQVDPAPMKQVEALKMIEQERLTIEHHLAIHLVDAIAADIPARNGDWLLREWRPSPLGRNGPADRDGRW
jgi:hypothetical protein